MARQRVLRKVLSRDADPMPALYTDVIDHLDFDPTIPCDNIEYEERCDQVAVIVVQTCSDDAACQVRDLLGHQPDASHALLPDQAVG